MTASTHKPWEEVWEEKKGERKEKTVRLRKSKKMSAAGRNNVERKEIGSFYL
jgi:hypothetical protein